MNAPLPPARPPNAGGQREKDRRRRRTQRGDGERDFFIFMILTAIKNEQIQLDSTAVKGKRLRAPTKAFIYILIDYTIP